MRVEEKQALFTEIGSSFAVPTKTNAGTDCRRDFENRKRPCNTPRIKFFLEEWRESRTDGRNGIRQNNFA